MKRGLIRSFSPINYFGIPQLFKSLSLDKKCNFILSQYKVKYHNKRPGVVFFWMLYSLAPIFFLFYNFTLKGNFYKKEGVFLLRPPEIMTENQ
ncbi:MAG: hypothetical protein A2Y79_07675 [Deltaproteobacteria bacterium RBG_13_43_22]|nr:MAG: hypothetical protein A2Y79_07675 [Deltaproteobacteria bacterium RBG_13_43_22]